MKRLLVVAVVCAGVFFLGGCKAGQKGVTGQRKLVTISSSGNTCMVDQLNVSISRSQQDHVAWAPQQSGVRYTVRFDNGTPCHYNASAGSSSVSSYDVPEANQQTSRKCFALPNTPKQSYKYIILDQNGNQCADPAVIVTN